MRNLNRFHLNGLRALAAVGRLGSLQAAAEELGVSVSAVSQQVIKAEKQLGQTVFQRTPQGLSPTEFGGVFLSRLNAGFGLLSQAVAEVERSDQNALTISVAPIFASRWLIHRLHKFSALYPDIAIRMDATTRLVDMGNEAIDLAIRVGKGDWPRVRAELLLEQEVFPVCSPALAERLKQPADILHLPAVIDSRAMFGWDVWLNAVGLEGRQMTVSHSFNEASLCLDAAVGGQGVLLAWQTLAIWALEQSCLKAPFPIRVKTGFGHYFVTRPNGPVPRKVTLFHDWLKAELEEDMRFYETL